MIKHSLLNNYSLVIDRTGEVVQFFTASLTQHDERAKEFPANLPGGLVNVDPAPITEDWLTRLGFTPDLMPASVDDTGSLLNGGDYWISADEKVIIQMRNGVAHCGGIACQALHELQNLYRAITNKELDLKDQQ